jgi:hypothetical protein
MSGRRHTSILRPPIFGELRPTGRNWRPWRGTGAMRSPRAGSDQCCRPGIGRRCAGCRPGPEDQCGRVVIRKRRIPLLDLVIWTDLAPGLEQDCEDYQTGRRDPGSHPSSLFLSSTLCKYPIQSGVTAHRHWPLPGSMMLLCDYEPLWPPQRWSDVLRPRVQYPKSGSKTGVARVSQPAEWPSHGAHS